MGPSRQKLGRVVVIQPHKSEYDKLFRSLGPDPSASAAPRDTAPGDEVVILPRSRTPFILRRVEELEAYVFVGDCFIKELMQGQASQGVLKEGEFTMV